MDCTDFVPQLCRLCAGDTGASLCHFAAEQGRFYFSAGMAVPTNALAGLPLMSPQEGGFARQFRRTKKCATLLTNAYGIFVLSRFRATFAQFSWLINPNRLWEVHVKRSLIFVGLLVALSMLLAACPAAAPAPAPADSGAEAAATEAPAEEPAAAGGECTPGDGSIAVLLPDSASSARWENDDRRFFEEAFGAAGVEYSIVNAEGNAATQQTQAEQAITNGARVLLLVNLDSGSGAAIIAAARKAGAIEQAVDLAAKAGNTGFDRCRIA